MPQTESLAAFIRRMELFSGTEQLRTPPKLVDPQGNILLPVVGSYLLDDVGGVHESANTSGYLKTIEWEEGTGVLVAGTFAKTVGAGTGMIFISMPTAADEFWLMSGQVLIGAVKVGGADTLTIRAQNTPGSGAGTNAGVFFEANANVNEAVNLPLAFADAALAVGNEARMDRYSTLIRNVNQGIVISLADMAVAEAFAVVIWFSSRSGVTPTVAALGGLFT